MNGRTYRYQDESPLYPFGYGLTYSDIRFEDYKVDFSLEKQALTVRAKIFNTGNYKTDEIIQLYVSLLDQKDTPLKTLIDFKRVTLFPDETAQVKFNLAKNSFSYFDADGNKHSYKGKVRIYIGNCSPGHRSVELGAKVLFEDIKID
jgi:beta-glucosidase